MKIPNIVVPTLAIMVGIKYILVETTQSNLIAAVFGGQDAMLARVMYLLACLLVLWKIIPLLRAGSTSGTAAQTSR